MVMIIKKQYIVPSVKTTFIDEQPLMAGSPKDWEVDGDETVGGQGAKDYNSFDDEESDDDFSSTPFK